MDLILISSAGLCTGALAADHFGRRRVLVTASVRGASGGPAGACLGDRPGGPVGGGKPADQSALPPRGRPGVGAARTEAWPRNPGIGSIPASPTSRPGHV